MATQNIEPLPTTMKFIQEKLAGWERPVVTDYELGVLMASQLTSQQELPSSCLLQGTIDGLSAFGLISSNKDFTPGSVYHLFGRIKPKATEIACAVDPFAYISHLSAMEYHGLTDRFSKILYLTTPPDSEWRAQAKNRMDKDLRERADAYRATKLPRLRRLDFDRVEGTRVELMRRSSRGAFKTIKSPHIRVATVGRIFLEMLKEPEHCGGIQHVVDTYKNYAARYLPLIVEELERHGTAIEKVRAGYLLDEMCKLQHPTIDGWTQHAQRGGSRMLDPQGEYAPYYSDRWKLSINVASLMPGDTQEDQ